MHRVRRGGGWGGNIGLMIGDGIGTNVGSSPLVAG